MDNPILNQLELCRKCDLFEIAGHYGIPVSIALIKRELKAVVLTRLNGRRVFILSESPGMVSASKNHPESPEYLLKNGLAKPSHSPWSFPVFSGSCHISIQIFMGLILLNSFPLGLLVCF